jgi:hypothetical protein
MIAIPHPIINRENRKTGNEGKTENIRAPETESIQARVRLFFSRYFCISMPAGIDIKPYAIKKEKGSIPVIVPLSVKLSLTFGLIDPRILVTKEITKNIRKIMKIR